MPFRTSLAPGEQFLLQPRNQFCIFAVRGHNYSKPLRKFQRLVHFAIIDAEKILVSEKNFERGRSIVNDLAQLRFCFFDKLRHRHVKRVVAGALAFRLRFPQVVRC